MEWDDVEDPAGLEKCFRRGATAQDLYRIHGKRVLPHLLKAFDAELAKRPVRNKLFAELNMNRVLFEELVANLPKCIGKWTSGSGGHAVFAHDCDRYATWTDDGQGATTWRFCDDHAPERLKDTGHLGEITRVPWFHVIQRRERLLLAGVLQPPGGERELP